MLARLGRQTERARRGHWRISATILSTALFAGAVLAASRGVWLAASGMAGASAWIGGMLFTLLIGQSADQFGYNPLFVALAGLDLLAAAVLWGLLRDRGKGRLRAA